MRTILTFEIRSEIYNQDSVAIPKESEIIIGHHLNVCFLSFQNNWIFNDFENPESTEALQAQQIINFYLRFIQIHIMYISYIASFDQLFQKQ